MESGKRSFSEVDWRDATVSVQTLEPEQRQELPAVLRGATVWESVYQHTFGDNLKGRWL